MEISVKGYLKMRRKDREKDIEFALEVADKCEYGVMSLCCGDMPYCIPISHVRKDDVIYFHSAMEGTKTDILRKNPNVCLAFVGDTRIPEGKFTTEYESAVIKGVASEVTDDGEKTEALRILCLKLTPGNMCDFDSAIKRSLARTAVWKIQITQTTGKSKALTE